MFETDPKRRKLILKRFVAARAVIVAFAALSCAFVHVKNGTVFDLSTAYLNAIFAVAVIESLIVGIAFKTGYEPAPRFLSAFLTVDLVLISAIVVLTGGGRSAFAFLYIATILSTSIFLSFNWSILFATICSALLLLVTFIEHNGLVTPASAFRLLDPPMTLWESWAYSSMKVLAFYLAAFLSGYLSRRIGVLRSFQHNLLNSFSSGFICADRDLKVTFFNAAAENLLQRVARECVGEDISMVFSPVGEGPNPLEDAIIREKECHGKEVEVNRGDGKRIPVGVTTSVLRDRNGKTCGALASFVDLTELKRMEERLRRADRLAAVGEMSASLAHEIRNPVASIRGSVQELSENLALDGTAGQLMKIAIRESDQLSRIISSFLAFVDTSSLSKELFDLSKVVDEAMRMARGRVESNGAIEISPAYGDALGNMTGDRRRIKEALANIIQNAIEATQGGGAVRIHAGVCEEAPDGFSISIQDEGVGIPREEVDRVFDPFYTTKPQGIGLGMAIAHNTIASHGGTIDIESAEGKGTAITVTLPREG